MDIVEKLRTTITNTLYVSAEGAEPQLYPNCAAAADEIERLRKQLVKCRADALEECAKIAEQSWGLMFTKSEKRETARKVSAEIAKCIRHQIPHLTDDLIKGGDRAETADR